MTLFRDINLPKRLFLYIISYKFLYLWIWSFKCVYTPFTILCLYGWFLWIAFKLNIKGAGGLRPGEGQTRVFCCFWLRGVSASRWFLLDQKILFPAEFIKFWNFENAGNYSTHANFKCDFPKMDIFEISKSTFSYIL